MHGTEQGTEVLSDETLCNEQTSRNDAENQEVERGEREHKGVNTEETGHEGGSGREAENRSVDDKAATDRIVTDLSQEFKIWNRANSGSAGARALPRTDNNESISSHVSRIYRAYEEGEEMLLDKLEAVLSYMDNFVAIQAVFPSIERRTRDMKVMRPLNFILRQVAKIYLVMVLIYLKRFVLRLKKINRLIRIVQTEYSIMKRSFLTTSIKIDEYHERCLRVLYTEKAKAIIEIFGYANDLLLNLSLACKKFKLGRVMGKVVGFMSWVVSVYRLCSDDRRDEENRRVLQELELKFGV